MSRFVLDASVSLAWVLEDAPGAGDFFTESEIFDAIVPAPWLFEVANGLVDGERRGKLTTDEVEEWRQRFVRLLPAIKVENPDGGLVFGKLTQLAVRCRLSVYDASYLELAIRESIPLATFDRRLRTAAVEAGVEVLP